MYNFKITSRKFPVRIASGNFPGFFFLDKEEEEKTKSDYRTIDQTMECMGMEKKIIIFLHFKQAIIKVKYN